ncbi:hypothetical protein OPQ81_010823 [Rhizoctonia solani]|nr:hypothetical protein OPQ81_010823 [Rhizoctonia solani]
MQFLTLAIASAFILASQANAQDIPQCIMVCFNDASATAGCGEGLDLACMCTNTKFTRATLNCVLTKCTAEEQNTALELNKQYCAPFISNSTTTASGTSASMTGTSAPASSTSTSAGYSTTANLGLLVASAGLSLFAL